MRMSWACSTGSMRSTLASRCCSSDLLVGEHERVTYDDSARGVGTAYAVLSWMIRSKRDRPGAGAMAAKKATNKRWVKDVKTVSTFPPEGLFTKDARTIARVMATKK